MAGSSSPGQYCSTAFATRYAGVAAVVSANSTASSVSPNALAVNLAAFWADAGTHGGTLGWETVSEVDNAGFDLYRPASAAGMAGAADPWTRWNAKLIPAAASGSSSGHEYAFLDAAAVPSALYFYRLESVAMDGTVRTLAVVSVSDWPARRQRLLLPIR